MKTLIISGTVKKSLDPSLKDGTYEYNLTIFGQSVEHPLCVCISGFTLCCSGYSEMMDFCREKYASYFNTDLFNIISMENITPCEKTGF